MASPKPTDIKMTDKPPSRMAAEERRHQILEVAIRLFSQKGFRGTTTRKIAVAAGVNEAIIFRHFATKSELYSAIIDLKACSESSQQMELAIEQAIIDRDDARVFESIAFNILELHRSDATFMRLLFYSALEGHELADIFFRNQVSEKYRRIADYINLRIEEGAIRKVDALLSFRAFIGMVIYHAISTRFFNESMGENKVDVSSRTAAERFANIFLNGISNTATKRK